MESRIEIGQHRLTTLLVMYALVVAIVTLLPFDFSISSDEVETKFRRMVDFGHVGSTWPDIIANVVFFVPWGVFLCIRLLLRGIQPILAIFSATSGGFALSLTMELGQLFVLGRWSQWSDLFANTGGTLGGALLGGLLFWKTRSLSPPMDRVR